MGEGTCMLDMENNRSLGLCYLPVRKDHTLSQNNQSTSQTFAGLRRTHLLGNLGSYCTCPIESLPSAPFGLSLAFTYLPVLHHSPSPKAGGRVHGVGGGKGSVNPFRGTRLWSPGEWVKLHLPNETSKAHAPQFIMLKMSDSFCLLLLLISSYLS